MSLWGGIPCPDPGDDGLMTRREAALHLGITSALAAQWTRRGWLPVAVGEDGEEIRDERGWPRYRRADVEELRRERAARA